MSESDNPQSTNEDEEQSEPPHSEYEYEVRFSRSEACDAREDLVMIQSGYSRRDALERARKHISEKHSVTEYPHTNIEPVGEDYPDHEPATRENQQYAVGAYLLADLSFTEAAREAGLSEEVFQDMLEQAGVENEAN